MRAWIMVGLGVLSLAGCRPSATVQRTTPLANLQPYRGLLVRGTQGDSRRMDRLSYILEHAAVARIRTRCAFADVRPASDSREVGPDDLMLDVTVQRTYRGGGGGLVQNENQATVEVKLVLSDGADEELVGAANIQGKSGGLVIGQESPEEEAINAVADSIASLLAQSGCTGPRVARTRPTDRRPDGPSGDDQASVELASDTDPATKAEAENEEGKRLFRSADVAGAKAHFEAAIRLHREPRYVFNLCLAEEDLGSLDDAESTCQEVLSMKPERALADKVKLRLKIIAEKKQQRAQ